MKTAKCEKLSAQVLRQQSLPLSFFCAQQNFMRSGMPSRDRLADGIIPFPGRYFFREAI
jgi:hypothetical protein